MFIQNVCVEHGFVISTFLHIPTAKHVSHFTLFYM